MFRNLSVGTRLAGAFLLLTGLLGAVVLVGLVRLAGMADAEKNIAGTVLVTSLEGSLAQKSLITLDRLVLTHITSNGTDRQEIEDKISREWDLLDTLLKDYGIKYTDDQHTKLVTGIQEQENLYRGSLNQVLDLSRAGKSQEALTQTRALLEPAFEAAMGLFTNLQDLNSTEADSAAAEGNQTFESSALVLSVLGGLAVFLAVFLGILLVRMIRKPVEAALALAGAISGGDLTRTVDPRYLGSRSEFGRLMTGLDGMQGDLAASVRKIDAAAGDLQAVGEDLARALADAEEAAGSIGKTVGEVNGEVLNQSASVTETSATINEIVKSIEGLQGDIEDQAQGP